MKRTIALLVALATFLSVSAQMRFVEAADLTITGKALPTEHPYHRIDTTRYKGFTPVENQQVRFPAGLAIAFSTTSPRLDIHATYRCERSADNTPGISNAGFDLYIRRGNEWVYAASHAPKQRGKPFTLITGMDSTWKECLLYLPIMSELDSLRIGVVEQASIRASETPFRHKIVIFGSSFTHGVSTSRAGMSYPMQIARNTGLGFCNIACSGNCKLQSYFADYLGDVADADAMVFDAFSNPDARMIEERLIPFIERIRAKLPRTPLIFVQTIRREGTNFNLRFREREDAKREAARRMMALATARFNDVYFIDRDDLTGSDHMTSVDGTHPSDLGYWRWAQALQPELLRILEQYGIR